MGRCGSDQIINKTTHHLISLFNSKQLRKSFTFFLSIIMRVNLPEGDGIEDSPSDLLILFLTRIKQMYTRTTKPITSRAAATPPPMAATLCFLGLLTSSCSNGVNVGTPLSPSTDAAILLLLDLQFS